MQKLLEHLLSLLRSGRPATRTPLADPILGVLEPDPGDPSSWTAAVQLGDQTVRFSIAGGREPHPALVRHAASIVSTWPAFESAIRGFRAREAAAAPPDVAEEMGALVVDLVCLNWPRRPNDGMIYFTGPSLDRIWRCDYVDRKPRNLGFDS